MKNKIFIIFAPLFLIGCNATKEYREFRKPFKNLTDNVSYLLPKNEIKSDYIFRIWFFESTSVDKVLIIYKNDKNLFESQLIQFGEIYYKKNKKDVFKIDIVEPKNGFDNLIKKLNTNYLQNFENKTNYELAYDEPIFNYYVEYKNEKKVKSFKYETSQTDSKIVNEYSDLINLLKSEFNLN